MIFLKETHCETCNKKVELWELEMVGGTEKGKKIEWKKGCVCEDRKLAREAVANNKLNKIRKIQNYFHDHSLISKDLEKATFENFKARNDSQAYGKKVSERFVDVFDTDEPRNILFHGSFGLGKSHLAKSIADGVIANGKHAIFISVPKLLRKIKSTYSNDSEINEDKIIQVLESVDLLVLDDLGAEKQTDWTAERIFDIIDTRQGMSTVYTTNFTPEDLIQKVGERNFSRVVNRETTVIEIKGDNYRLEDTKGE